MDEPQSGSAEHIEIYRALQMINSEVDALAVHYYSIIPEKYSYTELPSTTADYEKNPKDDTATEKVLTGM